MRGNGYIFSQSYVFPIITDRSANCDFLKVGNEIWVFLLLLPPFLESSHIFFVPAYLIESQVKPNFGLRAPEFLQPFF
jgi:hypothetical protein